MLDWENDLKLQESDLYMDSREGRDNCFVSHAHSDHLGIHTHALCTPGTAALARHRREMLRITEIPEMQEFPYDVRTVLRLLPAGHVLGSSMLHVRRGDESMLYTGDFKLRESLTVCPAQTCEADVLVMESTYGLPFFRFPSRHLVLSRLLELVEGALREGRQPIVLGYSLGKAQEIVRMLTAAGFPVTVHGSVFHLNRVYESLGVELGPYRRYVREDFHGAGAVDLMERGVLVAPPQTARSAFVTSFDRPCRIAMTGWALQKNAIYRLGVDHALPFSDHADFDELLELVERVRPKRIFTHHGFREFAQTLRDMGHDAQCAKKDDQLTLFGD